MMSIYIRGTANTRSLGKVKCLMYSRNSKEVSVVRAKVDGWRNEVTNCRVVCKAEGMCGLVGTGRTCPLLSEPESH